MLTTPQIKKSVTKIGKKYGIKSAFLFGSYANEAATEDSDVDILIEKGNLRGYLQLNGFRLDLADELGTDVDVVTINGVSPKFLDKINANRILLYVA